MSATTADWATRPLKAAVIGLGFTGDAHLQGYAAMPNVQTVALAGLEDERRMTLGKTYAIPHLYADWQDLLAHEEVDLLSICAPNILHAPIAIAALAQGCHVLCEKPLARNSQEATTMVAAARQADRVLHTVFNHRARGDVSVLKRHIDEGGLGRVYHAKASWMRRIGIPTLGSWFTNKELAGGGPLIDLGVHMLDLALYLMGDPDVITVSGATYAEFGPHGRGNNIFAVNPKQSVGSAFEVEDLATAFIRFADGATLALETSWATHGSAADDFGVKLFGVDGGAEITVVNYGLEDTLRFFTDVAGMPATITPRVPRGIGHMKVVTDFLQIVRSGDWAGYHGEEGLKRTQIIDACYASAELGREVTMAEIVAAAE